VRDGESSLHRSWFPRPLEWPLGRNGAASGERAPRSEERGGVPVGEEVAISVGVGEPSREW
jgi:hypothetical protein